jgi:hypothetical protein
MIPGRQIDKGEAKGAARRAWLSGLLVWSFVLQLLVPVMGPMRFGDSAAMAALGRIMPICTLEGLRLAEPNTGNGVDRNDVVPVDPGWHCVLCITPAGDPPRFASLPAPAAEWHLAWTTELADRLPADRPRRPQSARGPPTLS